MQNRYGWLGFYIASMAIVIGFMGLSWFCTMEGAPSKEHHMDRTTVAGLPASSSFLNSVVETHSLIQGIESWSSENDESSSSLAGLNQVEFKNQNFLDNQQRLNTSWGTSSQNYVQLVSYTSDPEPANWPRPKQLIEQVEGLRHISVAEPWVNTTLEILERLSESSFDSVEVDRCLVELERVSGRLPQLASAAWDQNSIEAMQDSSDLARMNYRLGRRLAVWKFTRQASLSNTNASSQVPASLASLGQISFEGLDRKWIDYLMLPEFKEQLEARPIDEAMQKQVARKVLGRIYSPVLKSEQAKFISQVMSPSVIDRLKEQASSEVDYPELLKRLEQYESQPSSYAGHYLNDQYQNLLWSGNSTNRELVSRIETHYRNANFRFAVSERLLNRMIPVMPSKNSPVSEFVKGAKVVGQSQASNQLRVNLIPSPDQAVLQLETTGYVQADTVARTKTFRVKNQGEANFQVSKQITINKFGFDTSAKPFSSSSARQNVVGLSSTLDNLPIFGAVARKLAHKKLREDAPETDRMFRRKVTTSAESQVEQGVETMLARFRHYSYLNLMQPLIAMELEPEQLQVATTENQLVTRYRLAGRDQMAANTARPRDSGNSLLSFQIHQSMLNNAIARLGLNGNTFTSTELREHIQEMVGTPQAIDQEAFEEEKEAVFGFAAHDPIRFDFKDDRLSIVLNLKTLKVGNGKTWKNLTLTAAYSVSINNMQITLAQDDDLTRLKGSRRLRLGDKAAISTVMQVLFKKEYNLNALPKKMFARVGGQNLKVSQFVMSDGWVGVSIDDQVSMVQEKLSDPPQRVGGLRRNRNRR